MKHALILVLILYVASASELKGASNGGDVIHIATALDHLTVLEFGEPVTMAAAGSPAFQVERHEDKIFIKPLQSGAATDLFVWTASRRFTYELEPPGEVKNMNFAIENVLSTPKSMPDNNTQVTEVADTILTRAFLGAEQIDSSRISNEKGRITVRIGQVFQTKTSLYVHYSIVNHSARPYRVTTPAVAEAMVSSATISMTSLQHKQLDPQVLRKLGRLSERSLTPARAENQKEDLQPGEETRGVLVLREQFPTPTVLELTFGSEGSRAVKATVVL